MGSHSLVSKKMHIPSDKKMNRRKEGETHTERYRDIEIEREREHAMYTPWNIEKKNFPAPRIINTH